MKTNTLLLLILPLLFCLWAQADNPTMNKSEPDDTLNEEMVWAVQADETTEALQFLARGADPNTLDDEAELTALLWASANGNIQLVQALLKAGADLQAHDDMGRNAIMIAVDANYTDGRVLPESYRMMVKVLLGSGGDVNAQDSYNQTLLLRAAKVGDVETIRLFLTHSVRVNAPDKNGKTPLMVAAENGQADTVQLLLAAGVNARAKDKAGRTALDWLSQPIIIESWSVAPPTLDNKHIEWAEAALDAKHKRIVEGRSKARELLVQAMAKAPVSKPLR